VPVLGRPTGGRGAATPAASDGVTPRRCWIEVSAQFTRNVISSRISESAIATSKLPFPVSSTVAVVKTRVDPRILPPTIIEAPTSEITPPKPAMTAASMRASRSSTALDSRRAEPEHLEAEPLGHLLDGGQRESRDDGHRDDELGEHHGGGCVEQLECAERSVAPEQDRDEEAHHHGRQSHARVHDTDDEGAAGKPGEGERRAARHADDEREQRRPARDLERQGVSPLSEKPSDHPRADATGRPGANEADGPLSSL
jgi:hypothetical protein